MEKRVYDFYISLLKQDGIPDFLEKYLQVPCLLRLKNVGYFCGMDYASSDIYDFLEHISRYDHSLSVALLTWKFTKSKVQTLAGLFHDIATPCFSHVIDYMNEDYEKQESTEEYTQQVLSNDLVLNRLLESDGIAIGDICDFKKYSIVDVERPKLCADRLDGIILTGFAWTKSLDCEEVRRIVSDVSVFFNESNELELGFKSKDIALKVLEVSEEIDLYCHSDADNYMMNLLVQITKKAIVNKIISYDDLYKLTEQEVWDRFYSVNDIEFKELINKFETIKKNEIEYVNLGNVKRRLLNPLVEGKRLKKNKI